MIFASSKHPKLKFRAVFGALILLIAVFLTTQFVYLKRSDLDKPTNLAQKQPSVENLPIKEQPALTIEPGRESEPISTSITSDHPTASQNPQDYTSTIKNTDEIDEILANTRSFTNWIKDKLIDRILAAKPSVGAINNRAHYNKNNQFLVTWDNRLPVTNGKLRENNIVDPIRSKDFLANFLLLSDNEIKSLKESHSKMIESLPFEFPNEFKPTPGSKGILYAGGGNYNWLVLISLKMLRDSGSTLPVEVFIPRESEYSVELCGNIFPLLGAKCIIMTDYIKPLNFKIKGYQLKSMALLLTSFEKVLLLDSDNLPVKNPDFIFEEEPFKSKGLVTWPDFWRRSSSPTYYDIVGIEVNETNQIRYSYNDERDHPKDLKTLADYNSKISYHDLEGTFPEASSESGQILINRNTHIRAIFLSLYYNYYGPDFYYGLMAQGQAGEGDKETILAAAHKLKLPYYQVQEFIREYGLLYEDNSIEIAAMGQYDPVLDYKFSLDPESYKYDFAYDSSKNNYLMHKYNGSETLFLHCNSPKMYPWNVNGQGLKSFLNPKAGERRTLYGALLKEELGFDFEIKIWETLSWLLCKHGDLNIKGLRNSESWCGKVDDQIEFIRTGSVETEKAKTEDVKEED